MSLHVITLAIPQDILDSARLTIDELKSAWIGRYVIMGVSPVTCLSPCVTTLWHWV